MHVSLSLLICPRGLPTGSVYVNLLLSKVATLEAFVTSVSWFPSSAKHTSDVFAAACSDGTVRLVTRGGREDKKASQMKLIPIARVSRTHLTSRSPHWRAPFHPRASKMGRWRSAGGTRGHCHPPCPRSRRSILSSALLQCIITMNLSL